MSSPAFGRLLCVTVCSLSVALFTGCPQQAPAPSPSADGDGHGHEEHGDHGTPTTLAGAVGLVEHISDDIKEAYGKGDSGAAHGPLHEIRGALDTVGLMISKSDLSDEQKASSAESLKELTDLYDKVDAKLHGQEGVEFEDVSEQIDAALAALEEATGAEHEHEDGHGDHEGEDKDGDDDHDGEHKDADGEHKDGDGEHKDGDGEHKDGDDDHEGEHADGENDESDKAAEESDKE